ncbi:MAG: RidA family protein [Pseudomonadota bacterium]
MNRSTALPCALSVTAATLAGAVASDIRIVNPADLFDPAPYGFSHAVVADDVGRVTFIAGQGGEDPTGALPHGFEAQIEQAYANLRTALDAVGAEPQQAMRLTTYVVDYEPSMLKAMTRQLVATFGTHRPAQTLVPVPRLALDGMLFEVDAIAVIEVEE